MVDYWLHQQETEAAVFRLIISNWRVNVFRKVKCNLIL